MCVYIIRAKKITVTDNTVQSAVVHRFYWDDYSTQDVRRNDKKKIVDGHPPSTVLLL